MSTHLYFFICRKGLLLPMIKNKKLTHHLLSLNLYRSTRFKLIDLNSKAKSLKESHLYLT